MTHTHDHDPPEARRETASPARRISIVWLVPLAAAIIGGAVAWRAVSERGPLVEIHFESASGVEAGKTQIRHKDVVVGEVEEVRLSEDRDSVVVMARLEKGVGAYVGDTTQFWIVHAEFDGARLSGIETLLTGAYIEMDWAAAPTRKLKVLDGLTSPPATPPGAPGLRVTLTAPRGGSLDVGSGVYFRQLPAGRIESRRLSDDGEMIVFDAFIDAPYDRFVSPATRFWNVSGLTVSADANGLSVHLESVAALLSGGVAFQEIGEQSLPPYTADGAEFSLFANRKAAEESLFRMEGDERFRFIAEFSDEGGRLQPGAPVEMAGVVVGRVIDVVAEPGGPDRPELRIYAVLQFEPARVGVEDVSSIEFRELFDVLAARGFRAQLASANLLTGTLKVDLARDTSTASGVIDYEARPYPALPTSSGGLSKITEDFEALMANLAELPLNDLVVAATAVLEDADKLLGDPALEGAPKDVAELAANLNALAQTAEVALAGYGPDSPIYVELAGAAAELRSAARSLGDLARRLEEQPNSIITGRQ